MTTDVRMIPANLSIPTPCLAVLRLVSGLQKERPLFKNIKSRVPMQTENLWSHIIRIADLPARKPTTFDLAPGDKALAEIAAELDLLGLKKLRFTGQLAPMGRRDWRLEAHLGATVTQACIVTLMPVVTRIDEDLTRTFVTEMPEFAAGSEVEMPEDDSVEPLTPTIDLGSLMVEALALALPLYPRAEGAHLTQAAFTEPGVTPLTDEDARPFAGLKALRDKLGKGED
jgi:uncharacterized metal-binding protein YceD (DUF177 family)